MDARYEKPPTEDNDLRVERFEAWLDCLEAGPSDRWPAPFRDLREWPPGVQWRHVQPVLRYVHAAEAQYRRPRRMLGRPVAADYPRRSRGGVASRAHTSQ